MFAVLVVVSFFILRIQAALAIPKPRMQQQEQKQQQEQLSWELPRHDGLTLTCTKCKLLEHTTGTARTCHEVCAQWSAWVAESVCSLVCGRIEQGYVDVCIRFKLCPRDGKVIMIVKRIKDI
jgi:hypothetical protein